MTKIGKKKRNKNNYQNFMSKNLREDILYNKYIAIRHSVLNIKSITYRKKILHV